MFSLRYIFIKSILIGGEFEIKVFMYLEFFFHFRYIFSHLIRWIQKISDRKNSNVDFKHREDAVRYIYTFPNNRNNNGLTENLWISLQMISCQILIESYF